MKFYLSSYKLGNKTEKLKEMLGSKKIAYIPNAIDYLDENLVNNEKNLNLLKEINIETEILDLKNYFGKKKELYSKIQNFGGVMVAGGNTFVLREAMFLSGFDKIIKKLPDDFLYAGWSAGVCVLAPNFDGIKQVDDPTQNPYNTKVINEGLGILDYLILPHYKSNHPESKDIDREVEFCKKNNILFRTLRDGEVIIF